MKMASKLKVDELRAQLTQRGLSTTGTRPSLIQRLKEALQNENNESSNFSVSKKRARESNSNDPNGSENQLVEGMGESDGRKKVTPVLDPWVPNDLKFKYHILRLDGVVYDVMLNQDVDDDYSKFYVIQLLESYNRRSYIVYCRWGKVGLKGQKYIYGPYDVRCVALSTFEYKFFEKTKNRWPERHDFICYPDCYDWLEMDYTGEAEEKEESVAVRKKPTTGTKKELLRDMGEADGGKKGALVLDQWLPDDIKAKYHILRLGDDIYDVMLDKRVREDYTKFYKIQLLESSDHCSYIVYNRWGKVGLKGQNKILGPYNALDFPLTIFEGQFFEKTKNYWPDRKLFLWEHDSYDWLEMDHNEE